MQRVVPTVAEELLVPSVEILSDRQYVLTVELRQSMRIWGGMLGAGKEDMATRTIRGYDQ
jgi:hypothetical protein